MFAAVGQLYSQEAGLDVLPREQLLTAWPLWWTAPENIIFEVDELQAVIWNGAQTYHLLL